MQILSYLQSTLYKSIVIQDVMMTCCLVKYKNKLNTILYSHLFIFIIGTFRLLIEIKVF